MIRPVTLVAAVGLTALCACGPDYSGDPTVIGPATSTPSVTSSAPSPSPGGTSPSSPRSTKKGATGTATLDEQTRQELLRTPVDYYEAIERAYTTLDYSEVDRLSSKHCVGCTKQLAYLKKAADRKYSHEGGAYTVTNERVLGPLHDGRWSVGLTLAWEGLVVKDGSGRTVQTATGVAGRRQQIDLTRQSGRWVVDDILGLDG